MTRHSTAQAAMQTRATPGPQDAPELHTLIFSDEPSDHPSALAVWACDDTAGQAQSTPEDTTPNDATCGSGPPGLLEFLMRRPDLAPPATRVLWPGSAGHDLALLSGLTPGDTQPRDSAWCGAWVRGVSVDVDAGGLTLHVPGAQGQASAANISAGNTGTGWYTWPRERDVSRTLMRLARTFAGMQVRARDFTRNWSVIQTLEATADWSRTCSAEVGEAPGQGSMGRMTSSLEQETRRVLAGGCTRVWGSAIPDDHPLREIADGPQQLAEMHGDAELAFAGTYEMCQIADRGEIDRAGHAAQSEAFGRWGTAVLAGTVGHTLISLEAIKRYL